MRKIINLAAIQAIAATGPLPDLDIGGYKRFASFSQTSLNTAGSSPTLATKLQQADPAVVGYSFTTAGATDNTLKAGASTTVKQGAKFTQSGARSIKSIDLRLKKIGAIAAAQTVSVDIFADSAGAPTGSSLGTAKIDIDSQIGIAYALVRAIFATTIDLADATVYHVVLSASYTASAVNAVSWRSATVGSAGNFETFDGTSTWTATATSSFEILLNQHTYTDITGGAFTGLTTGAGFQTLDFAIEGSGLKKHIRPYCTIGGTGSPNYYAGVLAALESQTS